MARPSIAETRLRTLALGFVGVARDNDLTRLVAEQELDGVRVEVTIERTVPDEENPDVVDEHVTVKTGPKSRPTTAVAIPAGWIA
ncbi:MAG: hypothetical protein PGN13_16470 [Patulibacter minatonensis]